MPEVDCAIVIAARTSASMSRPETGRTWMVISRPTSDCQSLAVPTTMVTAPAVSAARKVKMAITAVSERPVIEPEGTIGLGACESSAGDAVAVRSSHGSIMVSSGSIVDMKPSVVQHQTARVVFVHQSDVVGGNDHRRTRLVELDE